MTRATRWLVWMRWLAAFTLLFASTAFADTTAEVGVILDAVRPEGGSSPERGPLWTLTLPDRDAERAPEPDPARRRQVIFLVDLSRSMPSIHGRHGSFEAVVQHATRRAAEILEPHRDGAIDVSFYTFGDLRKRGESWTPHVDPVPGAIDIDVAGAIERLPTFIPVDPARYSENWTYVAASVFEAVRREVGGIVTPADNLPDDAPPVTVFVFTDAGDAAWGGGESHAPGRQWDHGPWATWLDRHVDLRLLEYHFWDLQTDGLPAPPGPDRLTYLLSWGAGGRVAALNRASGLADRRAILDVPRQLLAVPSLVATLPDDALRCEPAENPEVIGIPRHPLHLRFAGETPFSWGELARYAVGQHTVRLDTDALCRALRDAYPNSTFILPGTTDAPGGIGWVDVVEEHAVHLRVVADGTTPDAKFDGLSFNRSHQISERRRTLHLDLPADSGVLAVTSWTLTALERDPSTRDWAPVADIDDLARLETSEQSGLGAETAGSGPVTLFIPGESHPWWNPFGGYSREAQDVVLRVCAASRVVGELPPGTTVMRACPDCAAPVSADDRVCFDAVVVLPEKPVHWIWICLGVFLLILVTWIALRWYGSNPWPDLDVKVLGASNTEGQRQSDAIVSRLRHVTAVDRAWRRFWRKPATLLLRQGTASISFGQSARSVGTRERETPTPKATPNAEGSPMSAALLASLQISPASRGIHVTLPSPITNHSIRLIGQGVAAVTLSPGARYTITNKQLQENCQQSSPPNVLEIVGSSNTVVGRFALLAAAPSTSKPSRRRPPSLNIR